MSGANLRSLVVLAALALLGGPAEAVPSVPSKAPPAGKESRPDRPTQRPRDLQSIGADRQLTTFSGAVLDMNDRPLTDVVVKLFIDGAIQGSALTDPNGYYEIRSAYDPANDVTTVLWYVAPDAALLPKQVVIHESRASQANGLISRCVGRATLVPGRQFRVYLFDAASRIKDLSEMDCLP